jgi:hypothetical protein
MLWYAPNPTFLGRVLIFLTLMWVNPTYLYVWGQLTPRWYGGRFSVRLGVMMPYGAQRALVHIAIRRRLRDVANRHAEPRTR